MARRILILLLAFAGMVVGIEGIRNTVAWWRGELPVPRLHEWVSMACLPFLGWLWWRFLSPFGKKRGRCLDDACQRRDPPV